MFFRDHFLLFTFTFLLFTGCSRHFSTIGPQADYCLLVEDGYGPVGNVEINAQIVVTGLEVPWGIAFLPNGDALVTERPGRLRLVKDIYNNPQLVEQPLAIIQTASSSEGGLLGITLHPEFENNRLFYLYATVQGNGGSINRVEQWQLATDGRMAWQERIIFDDIRASSIHNGGRMRFGPDGMLYVGTGDASQHNLSQDPQSPNGKLLRITPHGEVPADNPIAENPAFLMGIRNTQGWDWPEQNNANILWLVDHGPSGDLLRFGHDEVNIAQAGDNLGWSEVFGCQQQDPFIAPVLSWKDAVPPGGASIYTGEAIKAWKGSLMIGTLGSRHLHRVAIQDGMVSGHEIYLQDEFGRLREVIMGGDGHLYITTSNCDGRGDCPPDQDYIIRISQ